jgi:hypothetical protein
MDTKPFMLPAIPYNISEKMLPVTEIPIWIEFSADYKISQYTQ